MSTMTIPRPATERQVDYIGDLIDTRDLLASPKIFDAVNAMDEEEFKAYKERLKEQAKGLTRAKASQWIDKLKDLPKVGTGGERDVKVQDWPNVPAGRYAVEHEGTLKFYRVDRPTEGRWAGYTFLNVQASDETYSIKNVDTKREVLGLIAEDPKGAAQRYGHELGKCGICGRTLTNEESRALGIGPVCAGKHGWV